MSTKSGNDNESVIKLLNIEDTMYKTNLTKKFETRKAWKKPDPSILSSVIPGTISKIYVKEKESLNQGDKILVLDAMKMKNTLTVPFSGVVKKIHVSEGQIVPKGFVMIEITPKKKK